MGAVPVLARGLGHMVPTYLRRRPGSPSNGFLGSALSLSRVGERSMTPPTLADPRRYCAAARSARRRARRRRRTRGDFSRAAARRKGLRLARLSAPASSPPFIPSATNPTRWRCSTRWPRGGFATALPVTGARGDAADVPPLAAGRADRSPARCAFPSRRRTPALSIPICCSCRSPRSTGAAIASATAPATTIARSRGCARSGSIRAVGVAYAVVRGRGRAGRAA